MISIRVKDLLSVRAAFERLVSSPLKPRHVSWFSSVSEVLLDELKEFGILQMNAHAKWRLYDPDIKGDERKKLEKLYEEELNPFVEQEITHPHKAVPLDRIGHTISVVDAILLQRVGILGPYRKWWQRGWK